MPDCINLHMPGSGDVHVEKQNMIFVESNERCFPFLCIWYYNGKVGV